jgi:hypothetical protein
MAPDRQDATHNPQPLQSVAWISAFPLFSLNFGAEYGHKDRQVPHWLQWAALTSATVPLTGTTLAESKVTARAAAAWACVMDSSIGFGA